MSLPGASFLRYMLQTCFPLDEESVHTWDEYWRKTTLRSDLRGKAMAEFITDGWSVLEIGCGDGLLLYTLKKQRLNISELGVDCSSVAVEKARQRGVQARQMDAINEKNRLLELGKFHCVILAEVLEHIQEAEELLRAAGELAEKYVLVTVPNTGHLRHRLRLLCGKFPIVLVQHHIREHIRFWTVIDFVWWVQQLGFEVFAMRSVQGTKRFHLHTLWPSLFSDQILYVLRPRDKGQ